MVDILYVQIVRCSKRHRWYWNEIDATYAVRRSLMGYKVAERGQHEKAIIFPDDCVIVYIPYQTNKKRSQRIPKSVLDRLIS